MLSELFIAFGKRKEFGREGAIKKTVLSKTFPQPSEKVLIT